MLLSLYWQLQMAQAWSMSRHGDNIMRLRPRFTPPSMEGNSVVYALDKQQEEIPCVVSIALLSLPCPYYRKEILVYAR